MGIKSRVKIGEAKNNSGFYPERREVSARPCQLNVSPSGVMIGVAEALRRRAMLIFVLIVSLSCFGCRGKEVAGGLSQREANEILSLLGESGISGDLEKESGGRGRYSVVVASAVYPEAVSLLHAKGLPAERKANFDELVSGSGLMPPSRDAENLKIDRAVAVQLEELLRAYPGVSKAGVVASIRNGGAEPTVSVVLSRKNGVILDVDDVKQLVVRAVANLKPENIALSVKDEVSGSTPAGPVRGVGQLVPFLGWWRVPEDQYNGIAISLLAVLLVVGVTCGLIGYFFGQYGSVNDSEELLNLDGATPAAVRQPRLDRPRRDGGNDLAAAGGGGS
jgi:type III secretory pathway lipoprotein EscJ